MKPVPLTADQQKLRSEISRLVRTVRQQYVAETTSANAWPLVQKAGELSHRLHMSLKATGWEPKHHHYMLQNRQAPPDDPQFYQHFHPIEDLLKFLRNPAANDDPADRTIGATFMFRVFSWRWGHPDTYRLKRTENGWHVLFLTDGGECDKKGRPYLYSLLDHDDIEYPESLPRWIEELWERAGRRGRSVKEVQRGVDLLAAWVSTIELKAPCDGMWSGFKRERPQRRLSRRHPGRE